MPILNRATSAVKRRGWTQHVIGEVANGVRVFDTTQRNDKNKRGVVVVIERTEARPLNRVERAQNRSIPVNGIQISADVVVFPIVVAVLPLWGIATACKELSWDVVTRVTDVTLRSTVLDGDRGGNGVQIL